MRGAIREIELISCDLLITSKPSCIDIGLWEDLLQQSRSLLAHESETALTRMITRSIAHFGVPLAAFERIAD